MTLLRTIHNAGCGSFCTETFGYHSWHKCREHDCFIKYPLFNVVYDCGSSDIKKEVQYQAEKYFNHCGYIDLLFISHLDNDHVNGIRALRRFMGEHTKVVLPYFEIEYRLLSGKGYFAKYTKLVDYLNEEHINIVYIRADNDNNYNDYNDTTIDLEEIIPGSNYASGTIFKLSDHHIVWNYIPFNIQQDVDFQAVKTECKNQGMSDDDIARCIKNEPIDETIKNKLKSVYNTISKVYNGVTKANMSSMLLISKEDASISVRRNEVVNGWQTVSNLNNINLSYNRDCYSLKKASCLYTGDAGLKVKKYFDIVLKYYSKYLSNGVGIMQIPHHGTVKYYPQDLHNKILMEMGFVNITIKSENPLLYAYIPFDFANKHIPLYVVTDKPYSKIVNEVYIK